MSSSTTPKKTVELAEASTEASKQQAEAEAEAEAGPSEPTKEQSLETEKTSEPALVEKIYTAVPEAPASTCDYIIRHASGKKLSEEETYAIVLQSSKVILLVLVLLCIARTISQEIITIY